MTRHAQRSAYFVATDGIISEFASANGKCPHFAPPVVKAAPSGIEAAPNVIEPVASNDQAPLFRFGRMFDQRAETMEALTQLGTKMEAGQSLDSINPSGYTYLGQYIAHEITFDKTKGLPNTNAIPDNSRSPQIDLDSLYGSEGDPAIDRFYEQENPALLKIGRTVAEASLAPQPNDLPRDRDTGVAIIPDERNDENLAVAQVHVAFARFHNAIVAKLADSTEPAKLRDSARAEVVKHFQWIVLKDYLATLLDQQVLKDVLDNGPKFFKADKANLFMPLEFSVAAFRLGHSMVRDSYDWNYRRSQEYLGPASIKNLFEHTNFSGTIRPGKGRTSLRLEGHWIIDWRRFFDFDVIRNTANGQPIYYRPPSGINHARRIDTSIDMDLQKVDTGFNHDPFPESQRSVAVRNLLRGYALGLPTGEEVAEWIGEQVLSPNVIEDGFEECFSSRWLKGKTPLWYYILREAEHQHSGDRLGKVGSRIVAETFVTLIRNSHYSILNEPGWRPREDASRPGNQPDERIFQMVDLLHFADVVNATYS